MSVLPTGCTQCRGPDPVFCLLVRRMLPGPLLSNYIFFRWERLYKLFQEKVFVLKRLDMTQQPLFCEDIYEALRTIGQAYGGSKKMGNLLWPDKPIDKAAELWANCLNRSRNEKLDPEQVLLALKIGREINCHAGFEFFAKECNYKYEAIEPEDEKAKLQREFIQMAKPLIERLSRLKELGDE